MNNFIKKKWLQLTIWLFLFAFYFSVVNHFQSTGYAVLSASYNVVCLFIMYNITTRFLFPRFYKNTKEYFFFSALVILVLTSLVLLIEVQLIWPFGTFINKEPPPMIFVFMRMFTSFGFAFFVGTSTSLMKQTDQLKENEKLLIEEKLATELKLLKAQINPHFIFNALNNIYSLTYMKSENAPDSVLKLSEMLRYVFYDCSKDRVSLMSEIKYIENFIAFQQMKSEHVQNISIQMNVNSNMIEIAPMLFIPFIENAFKYSRIEEDMDASVTISIRTDKETIHFNIINSIPKVSKSAPGSGMGIKNVRERLNIIYNGKHKLKVEDSDNEFSISLSIKI